jgi:hypothetical protein
MQKKTDPWVRIATLLAPFAVLAVLAAAGASDEAMSAGFLTAGFISYLVVPTLIFERRRLDRG